MKFKLINQDIEIVEEVDLNKTAKEELLRFINKYSQYNLSLNPTITTFTSRIVLNKDEETLNQTLKQLKLKQNSIISICDTRNVELALNNFNNI